MNNESVGKKIVEALKKQAESMDMNESVDTSLFEETQKEDFFKKSSGIFFKFYEWKL